MAGVKKPKKSTRRVNKAGSRKTSEQENELVRLGVICLTILALVFLIMVLMKY